MHHPDMAWTGDAGLAEGGVEDHGQYLPELEAGSRFDHYLFFAPIDANAAWACTPPSNTNHVDPYDSECGGMHTTDDNLCPSAYSNDASDKGWLLPNDFDVLAQRIASRTASLMKPHQAAHLEHPPELLPIAHPVQWQGPPSECAWATRTREPTPSLYFSSNSESESSTHLGGHSSCSSLTSKTSSLASTCFLATHPEHHVGSCAVLRVPVAESFAFDDSTRSNTMTEAFTVGKRPRSNHRQGAVACMRQWLAKNASNPYPSKAEKHKLSRMSGLTEMQVIYWFNNARKRSVGLVSDLQNMQCVNSN